MEILVVISTFVIAVCALANLILAKNIKESNDEKQQTVIDLYEAIVISNFISPMKTTEGAQDNLKAQRSLFKELYKGETKIFKDD